MEERISVERALELIAQTIKPLGTEKLPLPQAHGRVLTNPVFSPIDQPPFPRSPLDGYALHAADLEGASREHPVVLNVVENVCTGEWPSRQVGRGEAVRLMTGSPIPAGCDCVVKQEDTDNGRAFVHIFVQCRPWDNYCYAGEDFRAGEPLLPAGARLRGAAMGVLASAGLYRKDEYVDVRRRAKCAVFCAGDELVPASVRPLPPGKIYSSNEEVLKTRLAELGMDVFPTDGQCVDDASTLANLIEQATESADVIFTTGGLSVGDRDTVPQVLDRLGAEIVFRNVRLKPGSPMMLSFYKGIPVMSLSGNPFAAYATFELFGRHLLCCLTGAEDLLPQVFTAELANAFPKSSKGRRFIRASVRNGLVTVPNGHSSGQLGSAALTNCLVDIPAGSGPLAAGDTVKIHLLT